MRGAFWFTVLLLACVLARFLDENAGSGTVHAQAANAWVTKPGGLLCPSNQFATVACATTGEDSAFTTVLVEVPGSVPVYVCGSNASNAGALNRSNAATSCSPRCSDPAACPRGATFEVGVRNGGTGKCIAAATTDDAGVNTIAHCLR